MSEVMTQGIIGMPYDLAMGDELSRRQFHSRAQELLADYAALEADRDRLKVIADNYYALLADANAELAKLRAGQESLLLNLADQKRQADEYRAMWAKAVASSPQPSAVPDGWRELLQEVAEYAPPYGTIVAMTSQMALGSKARRMLAAAPSAPATAQGGVYSSDPLACSGCVSGCFRCRSATVQGVNQQLLEALENTATWIEQLPVPTVGAAGQLVKIDKAIAAARKEGGKV